MFKDKGQQFFKGEADGIVWEFVLTMGKADVSSTPCTVFSHHYSKRKTN